MILVEFLVFVVSLVTLTNGYMEMSHDCLTNRAIAADYEPLGETIQIGNITVYQYEPPGIENRNRMLIGVYDIYGFVYPNIKQVVDKMANESGGFRAILPDFYRNDSWNPDLNLTAEQRQEWIERVGGWETRVKPDLINLVRHYESEGVVQFAIFGFCWGGKVATNTSIELSDMFKASAMIHPSGVNNTEAEFVKIPTYLMPTSGEGDMLPFYEVLQTKFGDNCGHRRFQDMSHGFSGARGNFSDPLIQQNVNEVITTLGAFFNRNLNITQNPNNSPNILPSYLLIVAFIATLFIVSYS